MRRAILLLISVTLPVLAACGGGTRTGRSPTEGTPTVPSSAVRLVGTDSVAVTQKLVDAERAVLRAPTAARFVRLYAPDVVVEDFAYGSHVEGTAASLKQFRQNMAEYTDARWTSGYAGQGSFVIEERWDFTETYGGTIQFIAVCETRGGKVVYEGDYFQPIENLPDGTPLEPTPLTSAQGPQDTAAAAEAVALRYAAALQAKDAAAVAALDAPSIAFTDTASSTVGSSPAEVQAHYAEIFKTPTNLAFTNLRYAFGAGWAAVIWTAGTQPSTSSGEGVSMLEIRDGRIARETLYYSSTNVPFGF